MINLQRHVGFLWGTITYVTVQTAGYLSGHFPFHRMDMEVMLLNGAIIIALSYFKSRTLGKRFIYHSTVFAIILFLIAFAAHSAIGNITTAIIALIMIIWYDRELKRL